jgi:hypothetical protein
LRMIPWSLAYYIQNLERINRWVSICNYPNLIVTFSPCLSNAYYRSAVIGLREQYCSSVFPPLVFNYLPSAMRDAASNRRRYLTRCRRTTLPVVPFGKPGVDTSDSPFFYFFWSVLSDYELKPTVSWIPLTLQFPDFSSDLAWLLLVFVLCYALILSLHVTRGLLSCGMYEASFQSFWRAARHQFRLTRVNFAFPNSPGFSCSLSYLCKAALTFSSFQRLLSWPLTRSDLAWETMGPWCQGQRRGWQKEGGS